ncbi:MAG: blue light sensor protein [Verrucomicrobiales bacterium]|nr:blue light sensor protein [Verrucomicrobiales bacterium]
MTGILLYGNGNFLQLIEREAAVVDSLLQKIRRDPRHKNIMIFLREEIPHGSSADGRWLSGISAWTQPALRDSTGF